MTKQYPSQQSRTTTQVDREVYGQFVQWCQDRELKVKTTLDELMRMCIEGDLEVLQYMTVNLKTSQNDN